MPDPEDAPIVLPISARRLTIYLRLLLKRLDRIEAHQKRLADAAELALKLEAVKANIPLSAIRDAEEMTAAQALVAASGAGKDGKRERPPMEALAQTPEEIAELNRAYDAAELRYGQGRVPMDLDLYAEAEKMKPESTEEEP